MENKDVIRSLLPVSDPVSGDNSELTRYRLQSDLRQMLRLERSLNAVKGQNHACQAVKEYLFGIKHKKNKSGPLAIMMFAGAPAVGKTFMSECISEAMGLPHIRLDMSNYSDKESYCDLFGLNPSYKSSEPGELTKYVRDNPISVVTLDEMEKCHPNVMNRFLQVFERGEIEDLNLKETISFRDVIFVLTSNICKSIYDKAINTYNFSRVTQNVIANAMRTETNPNTDRPYFSEALISKMMSGRVILFNKLSPQMLHEIAVCEIARQEEHYGGIYKLSFRIDRDFLANTIIFNQGETADARSVKKGIEEFFERNVQRLTRHVFEKYDGSFSSVECTIVPGGFTDSAKSVFMSENKYRVLVFGKALPKASISHEMKNRIEFVRATNADIKKISRMDVSAAVIDVKAGKTGEAVGMFTAAIANEIPTYVYDLNGGSASDFLYYTDNGAIDFWTESAGKAPFVEWLGGIFKGMELSYVSREMYRSNKVLSFETSYRYSKKLKRGYIDLHDMDVITTIAAGDLNNVCSARSVPDVSFDDVICSEEIKKELRLVVDSLINYKKYRRLGYRIPRGYLLNGEPGTGKTMLAKALANAAQIPFIQKNATEYICEAHGKGARELRNTFAVARKYAPCILFIDEIDCISSSRMSGSSVSELTRDVTDAFLSEMDGFATTDESPVFVIAATNYSTDKDASQLDPAFLRRFDRKIYVELPKYEQRKTFISREVGRYENAVTNACVENIAKRSIGWSLADLGLVIQNSLRDAHGEPLSDDVLKEAFIAFTDGYKRDRSESTIKRTAIHEAGHIVAAALTGNCPLYATIVSRSDYGGYVMYGDENVSSYTKSELLNKMCVSLSGRAAEVEFFGSSGINTGAAGDIRHATSVATSIICNYGMDNDLLMYVDTEQKKSAGIYEKIRKLIAFQAERAAGLIKTNRDMVEKLADALMEKNTLDENEIKQFTKEN